MPFPRSLPSKNLTMHSPSWLVTLFVTLFAVPTKTYCGDEPLPKAQDVLDRYIEVTGGKANYEKLKSMVITGDIIVEPNTKLRLKSWHEAPERMYILLDSVQVGLTQQGYDKGVAWDRSPTSGPRIRTGAEKELSIRQAQFNPELRWREIYKEATTVGLEVIEGKQAYRIELIPKSGRAEHQFYDKDSGFLLKTTSSVENQKGSDEPLEQYYGDYKETDGITAAHRISQIRGAEKSTILIEKIEYNAKIAADRFDPPADVKALIDKEKTESTEKKKP